MSDPIDRQILKDDLLCGDNTGHDYCFPCKKILERIDNQPSSQPQYEELTPEEAASEIASGSILSASYWLDVMIALKQMGYAICRKKG